MHQAISTSPSRRVALLALPTLLVGSLLLTGCAPATEAPASAASAEAEENNQATSNDDAPFTHQDRLDGTSAEVQALLTDLSQELDQAGDDVTAVGIGTFDTMVNVDVHIKSAANDQNVSPDSLRSILTSIAARSYPAGEIDSFEINVWGDDATAANVTVVADEIGVTDAYVDREWARLAFPSSAVGALFS